MSVSSRAAAIAFLLLAGALAVGTARAQPVRVVGDHFADQYGRTLILRGVNLAGDSKIPVDPNRDPRAVSFIGRPAPLASIDRDLLRLRSCGFTVLRLLVPWEAVEHAGPGVYDRAYLRYLREVVRHAGRFGFTVFIDPHQDNFSRAAGGDGAPYWAVRALGIVSDVPPDRGGWPGPGKPRPVYEITPSLAVGATLDTVFFAGNDLANDVRIDGRPAEDYLQDHYIAAFRQVAAALSGLSNVLGFEPMNEPFAGYIGEADLRRLNLLALLNPLAERVTDWDLLQAASGFSIPGHPGLVPHDVWAPGKDIWRREGLWRVVAGHPVLLRPDYFARVHGKPLEFTTYLGAFQRKFTVAVRDVLPHAILFQEGSVTDPGSMPEVGLPNVVLAPHFYDLYNLLNRRFVPYRTVDLASGKQIVGRGAVEGLYTQQLLGLRSEAERIGDPVLIGELGIPYNMNDAVAYQTGDFRDQARQAALLYEALDKALVSYTIWTYTPDNTNQDGDHWNGEDFSIFSLSQQTHSADITSGLRTPDVIIRPYPLATAGTPIALAYDADSRFLRYRFRRDAAIRAPTEIFIPRYAYPRGITFRVSAGKAVFDASRHILYLSGGAGDVEVTVHPALTTSSGRRRR